MFAPPFRVSSYCYSGGCVAVARLDESTIAVRDTKLSDGPELRFTIDEWQAFLSGARDGEFDPSALGS
ncbi:MAG: DUF397 domain-containing protein [Pseudonocardia sp.]|nr:DUF397 domain-containing protein [Pseudonocardia sp.]